MQISHQYPLQQDSCIYATGNTMKSFRNMNLNLPSAAVWGSEIPLHVGFHIRGVESKVALWLLNNVWARIPEHHLVEMKGSKFTILKLVLYKEEEVKVHIFTTITYTVHVTIAISGIL